MFVIKFNHIRTNAVHVLHTETRNLVSILTHRFLSLNVKLHEHNMNIMCAYQLITTVRRSSFLLFDRLKVWFTTKQTNKTMQNV